MICAFIHAATNPCVRERFPHQGKSVGIVADPSHTNNVNIF